MKKLIASIAFGLGLLITLVKVPPSLASTTNEAIYTANWGNGLVRAYTINGSDLGNLATNVVAQAEGIAIDASNNIYVVSAADNYIRRFSPSGSDLGIFANSGISDARSLVFDTNGNLYVANVGTATVRRFSPTGVDLGNFISNGLANPTGMTFDESGNLYVANYDLSQVKKFSPSGAYLGVAISTGLNRPVGVLAIPQAQGGGFYVANDFAGTLIRYDAAGAIVSTLNNGTLGRLGYLARDSSGNIYVTRLTGNAIRKFSPTDQDLGDFAGTGFNYPSGIVIGQQVTSDPLTNGLVAYYPFSGDANDQSGNGNNGSVSGATLTTDRFGNTNSAFNFNGQNAQIVVNDNAALRSLSSNYTFNAWVNFASNPTTDKMILLKSFGTGDQNKWVFWRHVGGAPLGIGVLVNKVGVGQSQWNYNFPFPSNQWHMVTFSASGTNSFIAVNGTIVSSQSGNFALPNTTGAVLSIGGPEPGDSYWFNGLLDDIRIYNRSLSSNEVAQLYTEEAPPVTPPPIIIQTNGLIAYYPFSGSANDASGNGNNGSVSGATLTTDRFGNTNSAFNFNGQNAQIVVNDNAALRSLSSNYTFNAWVNFASNPTTDKMILLKSFGTGDQNKWVFWRHVGGAPLGIGVLVNKVGVGQSQWNYNFPFPSNQWHMVTFSASGTNSFIAVNGTIVSSQSGNFALPNTTGAALSIGGPEPGDSYWFNGLLDDIRIYNRSLSSNEVAQLYTEEAPPVPDLSLTNGLVAYYPFTGNANDQSGNGRNGTINGATLTLDRFGIANSAFQFSNSTIIYTNLPVNLSGTYTYSAWIGLNAFQNGHAIFELSLDGTACNGNPQMYQTASSVFYSPCGNGQTGLNFFGSEGDLTNQWRHFVASVNGGITKLYRDGVLLSSTAETWPTTASIMLTLGAARGGFGTQNSYCVLDDVRIYNRSLSSNEVAQLYALEAPSAHAPAILVQPKSQRSTVGSNILFNVGVDNFEHGPLGFQWTFEGTNISGATSSSLNLSNVQLSDEGAYSVVVSNPSGSTTSSVAILTFTAPPGFITQPQSQEVAQGTVVSFSVSASGAFPISYQWRFNGAGIVDATNSTLLFTNVQSGNAGTYSVVASDGISAITSSNATLAVDFAATITAQPSNKTVFSGTNVTFSVTATGYPLTYQWFFNATNPISGGTNSSLLLTSVTTNNSGAYSVVVGNPIASATSSNAILIVVNTSSPIFEDFEPGIHAEQWSAFSPTVLATNYGGFVSPTHSLWFGGTGSRFATTRPINVFAGASISFNLRLSNGSSTVWDNVELPGEGVVFEYSLNGSSWTNIATYNTTNFWTWTLVQPSLPVGAKTPGTLFRWRQLSNSGPASDHWALDDIQITPTSLAPSIVTQPQGSVVLVGTNVIFNVAVTGLAPFNYQWQFNTTNISGATNSSLALSNVQSEDAGTYSVVVANSEGSVTSSNAVLVVNVPPSITTQPQDISVNVGSIASFSVVASGTGPFNYQWQRNSNNLAGATNSTLTLSSVQTSDAGIYRVLVTTPSGATTSSNASLTVNVSTVRVISTNATSASSFVLSLELSALGNENAVGFTLSFDPTILTYNDVILDSSVSDAILISNTDPGQLANGKLGVAVALSANHTFSPGTRSFVNVIFNVAVTTNALNTSVNFTDTPTTRQVSDVNAATLSSLFLGGNVAIAPVDFEGDVAPRPNGSRSLTIVDWVQVGRFAAGLDTADAGEFQRADCAPRSSSGNGTISITDWVQAGRYATGLDPLTPAGGPTTTTSARVLSKQSDPKKKSGPKTADDQNRILILETTNQDSQIRTVYARLVAQGNENAIGFSIAFDPATLTFISATNGGNASTALLNVNSNNLAAGQVGVALSLTVGSKFPAGTQEVIKLTFATKPSASGTTSLTFTDIPVLREISDTAANSLPATYTDTSLVISLPPPLLTISKSTGGIILSWPVSATNFVLESGSPSGSNWTSVVTNLTTNGLSISTTLPVEEHEQFFRLKK